MRVGFAPKAPGALNGTVGITSNALGSLLIVPLLGAAQLPSSGLTGQPFADAQVGGVSSALVTLKNTGIGGVTVGTATSSNPVFSVDGNACAGTLAAGASCSYTVEFRPQVPSAATSSFSVDVAGESKTLGLSAQGRERELTLSTPSFGPTVVGQSTTASASG